eukprot:4319678-Pleurochrysis_carterae.AAC.2
MIRLILLASLETVVVSMSRMPAALSPQRTHLCTQHPRVQELPSWISDWDISGAEACFIPWREKCESLFEEVAQPHRIGQTTFFADSTLRLTMYICKLLTSCAINECIVKSTEVTACSLRSILRALSMGRVAHDLKHEIARRRSFDTPGPCPTRISLVKYGSMLLIHPIEMWRWWSSQLLPASEGQFAARQLSSCLWMVLIGSLGCEARREWKGAKNGHERGFLRRRLLKLVVDTPLCVSGMLPGPLTGMRCLSAAGMVSSAMGMQIALTSLPVTSLQRQTSLHACNRRLLRLRHNCVQRSNRKHLKLPTHFAIIISRVPGNRAALSSVTMVKNDSTMLHVHKHVPS